MTFDDGPGHPHVYWSAAIQPLPRIGARIPLVDLEDRVAEAAVHLRGWPYPGRPTSGNVEYTDSWIAAVVEWRDYHERWRFHTDGLFTHRWRDEEDEYPDLRNFDWLDAIWSLTEIWEFAKRLHTNDLTVDAIRVRLNVEGLSRRIAYGPPEYGLRSTAPSATNVFARDLTVARPALIADAAAPAAAWAQDLLRVLNTPAVSLEVIRDHQLRLLDRRGGSSR